MAVGGRAYAALRHAAKPSVMPKMKYFIFSIILIVFSIGCARDADIPWYGGKTNTNELADRSHLYEYYFKNVEESLGLDIRDDGLARMRIVNLVNKAIDDWLKYRKDEYRIEVKYLVVNGERPLHYEFVIKADQMPE